jgi:hypothetical protein
VRAAALLVLDRQLSKMAGRTIVDRVTRASILRIHEVTCKGVLFLEQTI